MRDPQHLEGRPRPGGRLGARILGLVLVVASIVGGIAHYLGFWK